MSNTNHDDLKKGPFDTWATTEARRGAEIKTVHVKVNSKAATRQAIIADIRRKKFDFRTHSDWKAKEPAKNPGADWDYKAIAIHHAGNSYNCAADGLTELRRAETTDIKSFGNLSYHYAIDCQGVIYEALDIRFLGAHIEGGNSGVIGIVFLNDLSVRGEAAKHGPGAWSVMKKRGFRAGVAEWIGEQKDKLDVTQDDPTENQLDAAAALITTLLQFFEIKILGGHREFAKTHGSNRPCPGVYGMIVVEMMRRDFNLMPP
ncbi:peptidoglycan recognition protein family protein [Herbaspirillum rubrisubalbicans]|uniref:N-acetylmuramoyl-L-alanine amidase n=1 Tax=Herbaspirillum rubrisubalbicans TaxID=80842 RepID=A0AAD0U8P9_9BURK|nr:peptidoglycan recognition family protein [Herbaspirillum rubrisubalbicans]AYR23200.1 N-acetylmuramoyl-L-alanine amidase [Herbaspirillum rubrisubalbicans]